MSDPPMRQVDAVATSLLAMVPTGLYGTLLHFRKGNVSIRAASAMSVTCAGGMYVASRYVAPHVDDTTMRGIFAAFLCASGVRMAL